MKPSCVRLIWVCCMVVVSLSFGQSFPIAPTTGVRDDTRALTENTRSLLSTEITAYRQSMNCDVWLYASTFLPPGEDVRRYAKDLRQRWSTSRDAILLAYDRASNSHALSFSPSLWQRYPSAQIVTILQQTTLLMNEKEGSLEARLSASLQALLKHLRQMEKQRQQSEMIFHAQDFRLGRFYGGLLGVGALGFALIAAIIRRKDVIAAQQLFLPRIQVGCRFGAPHGGGVTSEKGTG